MVGGTALSLQLGHRISVDLDLFSNLEFSENVLVEKLESIADVKIFQKAKNTLNIEANGVKVDLIRYNYPTLEPIKVVDNIRLLNIQDIACMKLDRGAKKDFFDLYFILKSYSLTEILKFHRKKFNRIEQFHIVKSLTYFADAEEEPNPIMIEKISWKEVKEYISESVLEI